MARIPSTTFKDWKDGETVNAADYVQELEIIRAAVNSTDDDVVILKNAAGGTIKRVPSGTVFPSSPEVGDVFYRTDQDVLYVLGSDSQWQVQGVKNHAARMDNPHSVTASQVGAYTKAETDALLKAGYIKYSGPTNAFGLIANTWTSILAIENYGFAGNGVTYDVSGYTRFTFSRKGVWLFTINTALSGLNPGHTVRLRYLLKDSTGTIKNDDQSYVQSGYDTPGVETNSNIIGASLSLTLPVSAGDTLECHMACSEGPRTIAYARVNGIEAGTY